MTTISELLLLIGRKLGEQPDGLKRNQSIKALSRLGATLDNWQDIVIDLPVEQIEEPAKVLVKPTPEFFEELNEQSVDEEDGASVPITKAKKATLTSSK